MKTFYQISITLAEAPSEDLTGFLWQALPEGLLEEENTIHLFFSEPSDRLTIVQGLLTSFGVTECSISDSIGEQIDWNAEWEQSLSVIRVSDTLLIRPSFKAYTPQEGETVIVIEPKMSFGTGEHQTTRVMLNMLEDMDCNETKVLDVGTGSAVLAIGAVLLGARSAIAIDNDEWCLDNGIENAQLNGVSERILVRTATIDQVTETGFDIVLANIQKDVLLHITDALAAKCITGGFLLLSGLLQQDEKDIIAAYCSSGMVHETTYPMDEWIGIKFFKPLR